MNISKAIKALSAVSLLGFASHSSACTIEPYDFDEKVAEHQREMKAGNLGADKAMLVAYVTPTWFSSSTWTNGHTKYVNFRVSKVISGELKSLKRKSKIKVLTGNGVNCHPKATEFKKLKTYRVGLMFDAENVAYVIALMDTPKGGEDDDGASLLPDDDEGNPQDDGDKRTRVSRKDAAKLYTLIARNGGKRMAGVDSRGETETVYFTKLTCKDRAGSVRCSYYTKSGLALFSKKFRGEDAKEMYDILDGLESTIIDTNTLGTLGITCSRYPGKPMSAACVYETEDDYDDGASLLPGGGSNEDNPFLP